MDRVRKKKLQPWSDLAGTYGLSVFDFAGAPPRDYESLVGLWANAERVTTRQAHVTLRALLASQQGIVPAEYYAALFDTEEEAAARYSLYESRLAFANRKAEAP